VIELGPEIELEVAAVAVVAVVAPLDIVEVRLGSPVDMEVAGLGWAASKLELKSLDFDSDFQLVAPVVVDA